MPGPRSIYEAYLQQVYTAVGPSSPSFTRCLALVVTCTSFLCIDILRLPAFFGAGCTPFWTQWGACRRRQSFRSCLAAHFGGASRSGQCLVRCYRASVAPATQLRALASAAGNDGTAARKFSRLATAFPVRVTGVTYGIGRGNEAAGFGI